MEKLINKQQVQLDSVSKDKQIQYKLRGQRYKNTNEYLYQDKQTQDQLIKMPIKQDQKELQMLTDLDTMSNLQDYEKERQIVQNTFKIENTKKISDIETKLQKPNIQKKIQIPIFNRQKYELQISEDRQISFSNTERSENQSHIDKVNTLSQKSVFIQTKRRSFNIFSDYKQMNQQIMNDVKQNTSSLRDVYEDNQFEEKQQQCQSKCRGTLDSIDEKKQFQEQGSSQSSTRYMQYQRQIKQLQESSDDQMLKDPIDNQINSSDNNKQETIKIIKYKDRQQNNSSSNQDIKIKQINQGKINYHISNISTSVSTASPDLEKELKNTNNLPKNSQKSIQNKLVKFEDQSRQTNFDSKQNRFDPKNPNYISIDSHLIDEKIYQNQQETVRNYSKSEQNINQYSMIDQVGISKINQFSNLRIDQIQQRQTDKNIINMKKKSENINDEDEPIIFINPIENSMSQSRIDNIDIDINQLQNQNSSEHNIQSTYQEKNCEQQNQCHISDDVEQIHEKCNQQQSNQDLILIRNKNEILTTHNEENNEIKSPPKLYNDDLNQIQLIKISCDYKCDSLLNSESHKENNTDQQVEKKFDLNAKLESDQFINDKQQKNKYDNSYCTLPQNIANENDVLKTKSIENLFISKTISTIISIKDDEEQENQQEKDKQKNKYEEKEVQDKYENKQSFKKKEKDQPVVLLDSNPSPLIQFVIDEVQENEQQNITQQNNHEGQNLQDNDDNKQNQEKEKEKDKSELLDSTTRIKRAIQSKRNRNKFFQGFSQNSTPNQKSYKKPRVSDPVQMDKEEKNFKSKVSNFNVFSNQASSEYVERDLSEDEKQNKQNQPKESQCNQYCIQKNGITINLIPPSKQHKKDKKIKPNYPKQNRNSSKYNDDQITSGEDFYDEEDEDVGESNQKDVVSENQEHILTLNTIIKQASNLQQCEEQYNEDFQDMSSSKYQVKYNQSEIGIGRYFRNNTYIEQDKYILSQKKDKFKKWCKKLSYAEKKFIEKSRDIHNFEYSPIISQGLLTPNKLISPQLSIQTTQKKSNFNDQAHSQQITEQTNMNQSVFHNQEKNQISYYQRIKPFIICLIGQDDEDNGRDSNELIKKYENGDYATAQEEFELMYYFKTIKKEEFLRSLKKGPPQFYRWQAWKVAIDLNVEEYRQIYLNHRPQNNHPIFQVDYTELNNADDKQIKKDVNRASGENFFCDDLYADKSQKSLTCILKALTLKYKNLGYCQGMHYIAAYLLLINGGDELQTFSMIVQMDQRFSIMSLFEEEFPLLQFLNFVFQKEFRKQFKKLQTHFSNLKIPESMWVVQWLQTLFINSFPLNVVCRFWDYIFYSDCILSQISIILSLLHKFSSQLIKMDMDQISIFIQKLKCCKVIQGLNRNCAHKPNDFMLSLKNSKSSSDNNIDNDSSFEDYSIIIDLERIIELASTTYKINEKEILSYIYEFKDFDKYKDKSFLKKMEDKINQQLNKTKDPICKQIHPSATLPITPKKTFKNENIDESQQCLLHPNSKKSL